MTQNNMQLTLCVILALMVHSDQAQTPCIQGVFTQVNQGLQNGILPTHSALSILSEGDGTLVPSPVSLNQIWTNWTLNPTSFTLEVNNLQTVVSGYNTTNVVDGQIVPQDEGQQNGYIQVNNQSVSFYVDFSLTQPSTNSSMVGVAYIPDCPYLYGFNISFVPAPTLYAITMSTSNITFDISQCNVTQIYANFPSNQESIDSLLSQLNTQQVIQNSLTTYYVGYDGLLVSAVIQTNTANQLPLTYDISTLSQQQQLMVFPKQTSFALLYNQTNQPIQYQATFKATVRHLQNATCEPNFTISNVVPVQVLTQSEFYSITFLQNLFAQAQSINAFNSVLNGTVWPIPYLSWFTGGWADINNTLYMSQPLNTQLSGECSLLNSSLVAPQKNNKTFVNNTLAFNFQYSCVLMANGVQASQLNINLTQVQVGLNIQQGKNNNYAMTFVVQSFTYTQSPAVNQLNGLTNWLLSAALDSINGLSFGGPIQVEVNLAPIDYSFDQFGLWIYPASQPPTRPTSM